METFTGTGAPTEPLTLVRALRRAGYGIKQAAVRLDVGVSTLYRWSKGSTLPDHLQFRTLAQLVAPAGLGSEQLSALLLSAAATAAGKGGGNGR